MAVIVSKQFTAKLVATMMNTMKTRHSSGSRQVNHAAIHRIHGNTQPVFPGTHGLPQVKCQRTLRLKRHANIWKRPFYSSSPFITAPTRPIYNINTPPRIIIHIRAPVCNARRCMRPRMLQRWNKLFNKKYWHCWYDFRVKSFIMTIFIITIIQCSCF